MVLHFHMLQYEKGSPPVMKTLYIWMENELSISITDPNPILPLSHPSVVLVFSSQFLCFLMKNK